jgi:uncharacterized protein
LRFFAPSFGPTAPTWQRTLLVVACLLLVPLVVLAAELPKLTGRVVDDAGMIDAATEASLTEKLADFEKKGSDQIVVATVPSLGGDDIESYANKLFRAWGLGQAGENNGVLLLISRDDRKMRIEVGYGLEGTLTDLHSKLIIENDLVPAFRAGDYSGGISKAVDDIVMVLEGNPEELEARGKRNQQESPIDPDTVIFFIFLAIWATIFFGGMAMAILPPIFGTKIGPGRYRWLGMTFDQRRRSSSSGGSWTSGSGGWSGGGGGGWSSGGGGFSGGGGSSGGGGASGGW